MADYSSSLSWLMYFFIYSFAGWVWESCYVSVKEHRLVNRGFIRGPFLPLYGSGALLMLAVSEPFQHRPVLMFFAGSICATVLEYLTGAVMETLFRIRYWDYSHLKFNLNGYISLSSSILWGVFTILLAEYVHPFVQSLLSPVPLPVRNTVLTVVFVLFSADFFISFRTALQFRKVLEKLAQARLELSAASGRIEESLIAGFTGARATVTEGLNAARSTVTDGFNTARSTVADGFNTARSTVADGFNTARSTVADGFNTARSTVADGFNTARATVSGGLESVRSTLAEGLDSAKANVSEGFDTVKETVSHGFSSAKTSVSDRIDSVKTSVAGGLNAARNTISGFGDIDSIKEWWKEKGLRISSILKRRQKELLKNHPDTVSKNYGEELKVLFDLLFEDQKK